MASNKIEAQTTAFWPPPNHIIVSLRLDKHCLSYGLCSVGNLLLDIALWRLCCVFGIVYSTTFALDDDAFAFLLDTTKSYRIYVPVEEQRETPVAESHKAVGTPHQPRHRDPHPLEGSCASLTIL